MQNILKIPPMQKKINENAVIAAIEIGVNEVEVMVGQYFHKEVWISNKGTSGERSNTSTAVMLERVDVLGYALAPSKGFVNGRVKYLDIAVNTLLAVLNEASKMADVEISHVNIVLNEKNISLKNELLLIFESYSPRPIQEALLSQFKTDLGNEKSSLDLLHLDVIDYVVDGGMAPMVDPSGMVCHKVQANVSYVFVDKQEKNKLSKLMSNAKINTHEIILRPIANSNAVLSAQEKHEGVVLLSYNDDEHIDVAIIKGFVGNGMVHFSSHACDGIPIDLTVAKVLSIILQNVTCNHGMVMVGNHKDLNALYVAFQQQCTIAVRIGIPQNVFSSIKNSDYASPAFTTLVGLLKT